MSSGGLFSRRSRHLFDVETAAFEVHVLDADPPVREFSHGLALRLVVLTTTVLFLIIGTWGVGHTEITKVGGY